MNENNVQDRPLKQSEREGGERRLGVHREELTIKYPHNDIRMI